MKRHKGLGDRNGERGDGVGGVERERRKREWGRNGERRLSEIERRERCEERRD